MTNISIALATFNGQAYLGQQLASLAQQTALPAELVVFDDKSSDNTVRIIQEFARAAPFPVHIHQNKSQLGYRINFMNAAAACSGELIAFCDQDDVWEFNKLSIMGKCFHDPKVLLAYHNSTLIDKSGLLIGTIFSKRIQSKTFEPLTIFPWAVIPGHTQIVRRSLLRLAPLHTRSIDQNYPVERMAHDRWYLFWASVLGRITYVNMPLVKYRQHEGNTFGWAHPNLISYILDHIKNAERYVRGDALGAKNRLDLVTGSRHLFQGHEAERVTSAIAYYDLLLTQSTQRANIYIERRPFKRLTYISKLLQCGAYKPHRSDRLGLDALLLDAFVGVLLSRVGRIRKVA